MPYIARKDYAEQTEVVGNGQCVSLVKALAGTRPSSVWREGSKVSDLLQKGLIREGTVIATFVDGRYQNLPTGNHAAIFVRALAGGIEIFDQWRNQKPGKRIIRFDRPPSVGAAQRPELYSVVE